MGTFPAKRIVARPVPWRRVPKSSNVLLTTSGLRTVRHAAYSIASAELGAVVRSPHSVDAATDVDGAAQSPASELRPNSST